MQVWEILLLISQNTIMFSLVPQLSRRLSDVGMMSCYAVRKSLLNNNHKSKHRDFCHDKDWGIEEWRKVVFSEESRFESFANQRVWVRRTSTEKFLPECLAPAIQQGRESSMVCSCITSEGPVMLHFVEGIINSEKYIETMEEVVL